MQRSVEGTASLQDVKDRLAAELEKEMGTEGLAAFDAASNHNFRCRCGICLGWWAHMGPEEPGDVDYGPFTKDEVNAEQRRLGIQVTE